MTVNAARILGLDGYGLEPGCNADFVVLQARDPIEAIRLRAARLYVVRRGKVVAESPAQTAGSFAGTAREHQFHRLRAVCARIVSITAVFPCSSTGPRLRRFPGYRHLESTWLTSD